MRTSLLSAFAVLLTVLPGSVPAQNISTLRQPHHQQVFWSTWWEANREPYLARAVASRQTFSPDDSRDEATLTTATAALRSALASEHPQVRAEAVVALARIDRNSKPHVLPLTTDPDIKVRRRAWVALGLLDEENELLRTENLPAPELEAVAAGLALLDRPGPLALERLRRWGDAHESWQVQRMALAALRILHAASRDATSPFNASRSPSPPTLTDSDRSADRALFLQALRTTTNERIAIEALAGLGVVGDDNAATALLAILTGDPQALALPVYRSALERARRVAPTSIGTAAHLRAAACLAYADLKSWPNFASTTPVVAGPGDRVSSAPPPLAGVPRGRSYTSPQQSTGGGAPETVLTQYAFRRLGDLEPFAGSRARVQVYPSVATIAAAQLGRGDVPANLLNLTPAAMFGPDIVATRYVWSPQRAIAALALGIYYSSSPAGADAQLTSLTADPNNPTFSRVPDGRNTNSRQSPVSRGGGRLAPGADTPTLLPGTAVVGAFVSPDESVANAVANMGDVLLNRLRTDNEEPGLRAACALGAGLANQPPRANPLLDIARRLDRHRDRLIVGHIALALGLLDDPRALDLAAAILLPPVKQPDPDHFLRTAKDERYAIGPIPFGTLVDTETGLLGARAAITALAVLADRRAAPTLAGNWGYDVYLSLEAARAMRWCAAYDAVPAMATLATKSDQLPNLAALAARSLGEALDRDRLTPRLARLSQPTAYHGTLTTSPLPIASPITPPPPRLAPLDPDLHALANTFLYLHSTTWLDFGTTH